MNWLCVICLLFFVFLDYTYLFVELELDEMKTVVFVFANSLGSDKSSEGEKSTVRNTEKGSSNRRYLEP